MPKTKKRKLKKNVKTKKKVPAKKGGRRNIRKIISSADLSEATKAVARAEEERKERVIEREEWVSYKYNLFIF